MFTTKDDFINQIKEDCDDIGLEFDEEAFKSLKKDRFKALVKDKIRNAAHSYLLEKKGQLSKLDNLSSDYSLEDYLSSHRLSILEKQLLFRLRTRMVDVKCNYPSMYKSDLSCSLCDTKSMENQEHILVCPSLKVQSNTKIQYKDIFSEETEKQIEAVKHWNNVMRIRKVKLKMKLISQ